MHSNDSQPFLPSLLQTPACWSASWQAAPQAPWPCPLHNPQTWSRFGSRPRWTWTVWPVATTAPCRPTNTSTSTRASAASGKVPGCSNRWMAESIYELRSLWQILCSLQALCPTSQETHWSTAQSWWRTTWSRRPSWGTTSCLVSGTAPTHRRRHTHTPSDRDSWLGRNQHTLSAVLNYTAADNSRQYMMIWSIQSC